MENRFRDALERKRAESEEGESMDETLSEAGEEMEEGNTPEQNPVERDFTTQELLQDLSGDDCANTATPLLTLSPRKDLELSLMSETSNMRMKLLSAKESKKNVFEGIKGMFLSTLDEKAWREFLSEFNQKVESDITLEDFKEELWDTVVKFGENVLMGTGLDEKAREELSSKMIKLREEKRKPKDDACRDISNLNKKTDDKLIKTGKDDKSRTCKMIKDTNILKAREGGGKNWRGERLDRDKEVESVMIVATTPSREIKSRKRRRETEELSSPSADAVSEKNLKETAPMVLARWKTAAYKGSSAPRKLTEVMKGMEVFTSSATEEDYRPQKAITKSSSTSGQTWEVDVSKEWLSTEHQATGKRVASDPLERNTTRNTARSWWMALATMKELEDCLKKLDCGVSRKRQNWATQQKAEINKLELGNQLERTWQNLLQEYFEEAMRTPSSALPLMANPFVRTAGLLMFAWSLDL